MPDNDNALQFALSHPVIDRLLNTVIDRLSKAGERKRDVQFNLSKQHFRPLFEPAEPGQDDMLWQAVEIIVTEGFFRKEPKKKFPDPSLPEWFNVRLRFNIEQESRLRALLNRPLCDPRLEFWQASLRPHASAFHDTERLQQSMLQVPGKSDAALAERLAAAATDTDSRLTLRQLSAKHLWSLSKWLEDRGENTLQALFGKQLEHLVSRPIHLLAQYPKSIPRGILFIENQDSFDAACRGLPVAARELILLYGSGFKSTARRMRTIGGHQLFAANTTSDPFIEQSLSRWLLGEDAPWPVYFWGDLDHAGLDIYRALKRHCPEVRLWMPGYERMMARIAAGDGHPPEADSKKGQQTINTDDLGESDVGRLLEAIGNPPHFVDQEAVYDF